MKAHLFGQPSFCSPTSFTPMVAIEQGEDGELGLYNAVYRCLQEPVRRRILFRLLNKHPEEGLIVPDDVHAGEGDLDRLHLDLIHRHLPPLEEAGLIRWDRDAQLLVMGPRFTDVHDLLEVIYRHDPIEP